MNDRSLGGITKCMGMPDRLKQTEHRDSRIRGPAGITDISEPSPQWSAFYAPPARVGLTARLWPAEQPRRWPAIGVYAPGLLERRPDENPGSYINPRGIARHQSDEANGFLLG